MKGLLRSAQALGESAGVRQRGQIAEEAEFATPEGGFQALREEPAERPRQGVDGEEEAWLAGD